MDEVDLINKMLDENPLIGFSVYTEIQVRTLREAAQELIALLDSSMAPGSVDSRSFNRAYGMFWLWLLGAYEVTRTMCQARDCFSAELVGKLVILKKQLSVLRMPFAKLEYQGEHTPIQGEASVSGVDTAERDISFEVKGVTLSVRDLISEFESVFGGVTRADVLASHSSAYREAS